MEEIYIIKVIPKKITGYQLWDTTISQECYKNKEQAIDFCKSKLNNEELKLYEKQLARDLINWYEFESKNYRYEIKVLSLK